MNRSDGRVASPADGDLTLPFRMRALLVLAALGVVAMLGGLCWDAVLHARSPELAHHEGVVTLSNPAHVCLFAGLAASVVGVAGACWLGLVGRRARGAFVTGALVVVTAASATMAWAAGEQAHGHRAATSLAAGASGDQHTHDAVATHDASDSHAPAPTGGAQATTHAHSTGDCRPTPAQDVAADKLIADTRAATTRFADLAAAKAAGFRPATPPQLSVVHYVNAAYLADGRELDPSRPESLVYVNTTHGAVLAGAMYLANQSDADPPQVGGCRTQWHTHADLCFSAATLQVVAFTGADGTCESTQVHYVPPPMMHVWLVDVPDGPFAHDVDGAALARSLGN